MENNHKIISYTSYFYTTPGLLLFVFIAFRKLFLQVDTFINILILYNVYNIIISIKVGIYFWSHFRLSCIYFVKYLNKALEKMTKNNLNVFLLLS